MEIRLFSSKIHNFLDRIFFSSLEKPGLFSPNQICSARGEDDDIIKKIKNKNKNNFFFFFLSWLSWFSWNDYAYVGIIMYLLSLALLGQLLLLLLFWV